MKTIGILALQGDFAAHQEAIRRAGAIALKVTEASQFDQINGLIIPGGESTTILKLLSYEGLQERLLRFGQEKPILGTCAGAILMASEVCQPQQYCFGWMDMTIERNAYGRQIDSCIQVIQVHKNFQEKTGVQALEAVFIRAPRILKTSSAVEVLASYEGYPVLVAQGKHLAATFHPELTSNLSIHTFFLQNVDDNC